jgi:hypothetical protein
VSAAIGLDPRLLGLGLKPKLLARMQAVGADPEFGRLLALGVRARWPYLFALIFPLGMLIVGVVKLQQRTGHVISATSATIAAAGFLLFGLIQLPLFVWLYIRNASQWRFFEQGVTLWNKRRGDIQRLAYLDVAFMTYALTVQTVHGAIVGTSGVLTLEPEKGSKFKGVKHSFSHRQKVRGFFDRRFEGTDPMDFVRDAVAEVVAERLALEVADKGSVPWCGPATFNTDGLTIKKLLGGVKVVPYSSIVRVEPRNNDVSIFVEGAAGAAVSLPYNAKNFWPGLVLLQRIAPRLPWHVQAEVESEDED